MKSAKALGVDPAALEKCLCERSIKVGTETVMKTNPVKTAVTTRDALARGIYG